MQGVRIMLIVILLFEIATIVGLFTYLFWFVKR